MSGQFLICPVGTSDNSESDLSLGSLPTSDESLGYFHAVPHGTEAE
jgi:hypothetical protein